MANSDIIIINVQMMVIGTAISWEPVGPFTARGNAQKLDVITPKTEIVGSAQARHVYPI